LLPVGFAVPLPLPAARCALTAPFHPCRGMPWRSVLCGTVPGVAPAGCYPAPFVRGARTFLPGDLSVCAGAAVRPTDPIGMECRRPLVKSCRCAAAGAAGCSGGGRCASGEFSYGRSAASRARHCLGRIDPAGGSLAYAAATIGPSPPAIIAITRWPEPAPIVQPSVPWPVLSHRLRYFVRPT